LILWTLRFLDKTPPPYEPYTKEEAVTVGQILYDAKQKKGYRIINKTAY